MLCSNDPSDRQKFLAFFRHSEVGERGRINVNTLIYQVDTEFTKAIFDCEGLFELGKIRHPTCTLF